MLNKFDNIIYIIILLFFSLTYSINCFAYPWIDIDITYDGVTKRYNAEEVCLYVNGVRVENLSMPPIILDGFTLVPAREVFTLLSAEIEWNKDTQEINISYKNKYIIIKINSDTAFVNSEPVALAAPAKIINNKTMLPVRFIGESLGLSVEWDSEKRIINIREVSEPDTELVTIEPFDEISDAAQPDAGFLNSADSYSPAESDGAEPDTDLDKTAVKYVNLNSPECSEGIFEITADDKLGDFAVSEINNKEISFLFGRTVPPKEKEYKFDDSYVKKAEFEETSINGVTFTKITLTLKKSHMPVSYITKDSNTFTVDFISDSPVYENLYITDLDEEPLASDYELELE